MRNAIRALRMFLWMSLLTGIIYPLLILLIAQTTASNKANGSLIVRKDSVIGSSLIAQKFESTHYFWSRPSAGDYDPMHSGGSNLSPTSSKLKKLVEERQQKIITADGIKKVDLIPDELVYASGSGLDPHISPETAYFQINRIVNARNNPNITKETLRQLIDKKSQKRVLDFIGQAYVNVLELNLAMDEIK